ncbi:hydroxymethylglutaryl-CoA lyase [soil metagenome]
MQGWKILIPTELKVAYINSLLQVGFDTIDFGSFVSAKAIPQMADTKDVINKLILDNTQTKLLAIIANVRGAIEAAAFDAITYLGFPLSISETFQMRNTNSTIKQAVVAVKEIKNICDKNKKLPVVYLSMGFGNPYGDAYNEQIVIEKIGELINAGIKIISIADTVGVATPEQISNLLNKVIPVFAEVEIGVHLHASPVGQIAKIKAASDAGCKRFDGALKGIGGCPMAEDDLVGNMNTEIMLDYFEKHHIATGINSQALAKSLIMANEIFI